MKKVLLLTLILCTATGLLYAQTGNTQKEKDSIAAKAEDEKKAADAAKKQEEEKQAMQAANDATDTTHQKVDTTCQCNFKGVVTNGMDWFLVFTPVILFALLILLLLFAKGLKEFDFQGALAENVMPKHTIINPEYIKQVVTSTTTTATGGGAGGGGAAGNAPQADAAGGAGANGGTPQADAAGGAPANVPAATTTTTTTTGGISGMVTSLIASAGTDKNINLEEIIPATLEVTILPGSTEVKDNYRASISRYIAFFSGMLTVIIAVCMASFFIYHYIRTSCAPDLSALSTVLIALGLGVAPYAINKISGAVASRKTDE